MQNKKRHKTLLENLLDEEILLCYQKAQALNNALFWAKLGKYEPALYFLNLIEYHKEQSSNAQTIYKIIADAIPNNEQ